MTQLVLYEAACRALAAAVSADEFKAVRYSAIGLEAIGRAAKNFDLQINAVKLQVNAELRLGDLLLEAEEKGELKPGRPKNGTENGQLPRFTLDEIGVDRRLSARAQKLSGIGQRAVDAMLSRFEDESRKRRRLARDVIAQATETDKKQRRINREVSLAEMQRSLPDKVYGVIYADPEWDFEVRSRETGMDRHAGNHYPTSPTDAICARPVEKIAAKDCALFLWATVPMLPQALDVMAAWGFVYKSQLVWTKDKIGTGYWFRNQHEILLVGTRGSVPAPAPGTQAPSVLHAPVGAHSEKPDAALDLIERYFPSLPKIELNARRARAGWDAWGYEAPNGGNTG